MTEEEKINWLKNASNEELIDELRECAIYSSHVAEESLKVRIEYGHDFNLCKAELLNRLNR